MTGPSIFYYVSEYILKVLHNNIYFVRVYDVCRTDDGRIRL